MHTLVQLQSGQLLGIKRLKLSCELSEFPKEIFDLAETLEILDLSGNKLSSLPADFGKLKHLKIAFFSDNFFTEYPTVLVDCPDLEMVGFKANQISTIPSEALSTNLRWLILTNNRIEAIPSSIGKCIRLQKCMLAGNRLKALPVEMANCTNLELLRISANQFESLPNWLLTMPKLSWLAFASNPFCASWQKLNALEEIDWLEFELKEQLGEGASGNISKALWTDKQLDVAVKVFKGEVTSDGLPSDEMNSTIGAGKHPNLVTVLGKLKNHPAQKQGLVFGLIPPRYKNLGQPPSFESCTRDNYIEGTIFSSETILEIAKGMASVCTHLHANGLSHSDFYAHNILIDENNHALLGDFGAGVSYDINSEFASYFERLEVRAFGCLLEDLLNHVVETDSIILKDIYLLKEECMQIEVIQRPSFENLLNRLLNF
jgi:hypothetical protein